MTRKVAILNDHQWILESWQAVYEEKVHTFTHPRQLLYFLQNNPEECAKIEYYVIDRQCHSCYDAVTENLPQTLREAGARGRFLLSSVTHEKGEKVPGFDCSIGALPLPLNELKQFVSTQVS